MTAVDCDLGGAQDCPLSLVEAEVQYLLNYVKRLREESGFVQAALIAKPTIDIEPN